MTVGRASIDSYIKNLTYENTDKAFQVTRNPVHQILTILHRNAVAEVSFWGTRVIRVVNMTEYSGTIAITEIYPKAKALVAGLDSEDEATTRLPYIAEKLNELNKRATAAAKTANFFTRFLVFVRDWFSPVEKYDNTAKNS